MPGGAATCRPWGRDPDEPEPEPDDADAADAADSADAVEMELPTVLEMRA